MGSLCLNEKVEGKDARCPFEKNEWEMQFIRVEFRNNVRQMKGRKEQAEMANDERIYTTYGLFGPSGCACG